MNRIIAILLSIIGIQLILVAYVEFFETKKESPKGITPLHIAIQETQHQTKSLPLPKKIEKKAPQPPSTAPLYISEERQNMEALQKEIQALVSGSKELSNIQTIQSCLATLPPIMLQENPPPSPKKSLKKAPKQPSILKKIEKYAKAKLGNRYVWGATGPNNFDCSGFTKEVFHSTLGINIPRVSREQAKFGKRVEFKDLRRGDMVFFDTEKKFSKRVNHVGIYLSNGRFIHASSAKKKVVITSFRKKPFYKKRFLWGRRVVNSKS